jgi:acyl-coenzyme A thioesterase PaaI-like protein
MNVKEFIRSGIGAVPCFQTISLQIEMMDERGSLLRMSSTRKHMNLWGTVRGGVIASLAEKPLPVIRQRLKHRYY